MKINVNGAPVYASTGGRDPVNGNDWIIFLHGAGQNHLTWSQQVRSFAYDGYNVLAPDLPAHGASGGEALESVEDMAGWLIALMDELGISQAHLVNHSMGGLISMEAASKNQERFSSSVFIATAMTIAVGEALIEASRSEPGKAHAMMTSMGMSYFGHSHNTNQPGASLIGSGLQIMALNEKSALTADLLSCAGYKNGANAAAKVKARSLCLLSRADRMVAARFGEKLNETLPNSESYLFQKAGHMLPAERPREINQKIREFYAMV